MKTKIPLIVLLLSATLWAQDPGKVSPELANLKKQYEKDMEQAAKPVKERYVSSLESLLRSATVRGDSASIVAIKAELDLLKPSTGVVGIWNYTGPFGKGVREIRGDGTFAVKLNGPAVGKWEMDANNLTLNYPHGTDVFALPIAAHNWAGRSSGGTAVELTK